MTPVARGGLAGAVLVPVVGVAMAWLLDVAAAGERSAATLVYALGTLPLAVIVGAVAGRRTAAAAPGGVGLRLLGGLVALGAAAVVALLQARVRFSHLGAEGAGSFGTLVFAEELAMVGSLAFAVIAAGAAAMSAGARPPEFSPRRFAMAALAGAVVALLAGPTLILTAAASRVGVDPLVLALILVAGVALVSVRRSPST